MRTKLIFLVCVVFLGCGEKSPTGKPGRLGSAYDASAHYKNLVDGDSASMPSAHRKNLEAIKSALQAGRPQTHGKRLRVVDGDLTAVIRISWETMPVGERHLIWTASLDGLEFSEGTSCTAGEFRRQETTVPFFDLVSLELSCSRRDGSSHLVLGRTLYWNGADGVNKPLIPDGELHVSGSGTELSD